jgi:hypothetical protein
MCCGLSAGTIGSRFRIHTFTQKSWTFCVFWLSSTWTGPYASQRFAPENTLNPARNHHILIGKAGGTGRGAEGETSGTGGRSVWLVSLVWFFRFFWFDGREKRDKPNLAGRGCD